MIPSHKIGFGIIGTGAIAGIHATCIRQIQNAELIAMASSSESRAKEATERFNVPVYSDYNLLIQNSNIDIICICTRSGSHLEPTLAAARAGKHVLCEKPLEVTVERAQEMIIACKKEGVKLGCIFQNRFSPDFMELKNAIDEGWLGKLLMAKASINWYRNASYYAESNWRGTIDGDGGAALINQGIHTIDLLLNIMGEVKSVYGKVKTMVHKIEGEDTANVIIDFKNGAFGNITAGTSLYPGYPERLEIYGEKGSVILEAGKIINWNILDHERIVPEETGKKNSGSSDPMAITHDLHRVQYVNMIEAVINNKEPLVNGEEGLKSIKLIRGIYNSAAQKKEIDLSERIPRSSAARRVNYKSDN